MKRLFYTLLILLISTASFSQILIGPKVGAIFSKTVFHKPLYNIDYKNRYKPGFTLGGAMNYHITKTFSFQAELAFSLKGKRQKARNDPEFNHIANHYYIDLPLLLRVSFPQDRYALYFNVGPNISYWLGGHGSIHNTTIAEFPQMGTLKYRIKFSNDTIITDYKTMNVHKPRRLQFGIDLGFGAMVPLANNRDQLMIDFRYTLGHSYLGQRNGADVNYQINFNPDNLEAAPRVIAFSIAYLRGFDMKAVLKKGKSVKPKNK